MVFSNVHQYLAELVEVQKEKKKYLAEVAEVLKHFLHAMLDCLCVIIFAFILFNILKL